MNKSFWKKVSSLWVQVQSKDDYIKIEEAAKYIVNDVINERKHEKTFLEEMMSGIDEENDDGY